MTKEYSSAEKISIIKRGFLRVNNIPISTEGLKRLPQDALERYYNEGLQLKSHDFIEIPGVKSPDKDLDKTRTLALWSLIGFIFPFLGLILALVASISLAGIEQQTALEKKRHSI